MKVLFRKDFLISFGEADPQGILYFSRVQDLAHRTLEEFCIQIPIGWAGWFRDEFFAVPIKKSESEFFAPLTAGEYVTCALSVEKLGESSVQFRFELRVNEQLCATVQTVHVFVRRTDFSKIVIPPQIRKLLEQVTK